MTRQAKIAVLQVGEVGEVRSLFVVNLEPVEGSNEKCAETGMWPCQVDSTQQPGLSGPTRVFHRFLLQEHLALKGSCRR